MQGLSRLLRLEQKSRLSKVPRSGHILVHKYGRRVSVAPEALAAAEAAADSDYSSIYLPKHLGPRSCVAYFAGQAANNEVTGDPLRVVWDSNWSHSPYFNGLQALPSGPVQYNILDATPLLVQYPNLNLGIPLELTWVTENPGRQGRLTGSFHPLEGVDWTQQAYARCACCL